jgi:hypothetical protein
MTTAPWFARFRARQAQPCLLMIERLRRPEDDLEAAAADRPPGGQDPGSREQHIERAHCQAGP